MKKVLEKWQNEYLLLDFEHPFLADTIEEELILFGLQDFSDIITRTAAMFSVFKADFEQQQSLQLLSGGEKAALALILYFNIAITLGKPVKFLLYNILESLSHTNQTKLLELLAENDDDNQIAIYRITNEEPEKIS